MSYNNEIIQLLLASGATPGAIARYCQDVPAESDNLETIGYYWSQKISSLNVNICEYADVCLFLRDSASPMIWFDIFRRRVIPIIVHHRLVMEH